MTSEEAVREVVRALNRNGIPFMIVGSFALNFHGRPRLTKDADIVVECGFERLPPLFRELGPDFRLNPQLAFESVTCTQKMEARFLPTGFVIEFFKLSDQEHDQERFRRRLFVQHLGEEVGILRAEDLLVTKLNWGSKARRKKDVDDVRFMIALHKDDMDWPYVESWANRLGSADLLAELRAGIPQEPSGPPESSLG